MAVMFTVGRPRYRSIFIYLLFRVAGSDIDGQRVFVLSGIKLVFVSQEGNLATPFCFYSIFCFLFEKETKKNDIVLAFK